MAPYIVESFSANVGPQLSPMMAAIDFYGLK